MVDTIQTMAQSNTPFVSNNGNPNTVYNTAATPFGGQAAMPATSAFAAPQTQFWRNMSGVQKPVFAFNDEFYTGTDRPWVPATPEPPPPVTPPPVINPWTPPTQVGTDKPPGHAGDGNIPGTITNDVFRDVFGPSGNPANVHLGWNSSGQGSMDTGNGTVPINNLGSVVNGLTNLATRVGEGFGYSNGQFDPMQFLDAVSEIFLPGDLYNANVGRFNSMNFARSLLNKVIPGLGNFGQWLITMLPEGNPLTEWVRTQQQQNIDDAAIPANNTMSGIMDGMTNVWLGGLDPFGKPTVSLPSGYTPTGTVTASGLNSTGTWTTAQTPEEIEAGYAAAALNGGGNGPFTPGSAAAGSNVLAQGADAQRWVQSMRDQQSIMNKPAQTPFDLFGMVER